MDGLTISFVINIMHIYLTSCLQANKYFKGNLPCLTLNFPVQKYLRPHRYMWGWNQITHQWYYHGYRYNEQYNVTTKWNHKKRYTTCYFLFIFFTLRPPSDLPFLKKSMFGKTQLFVNGYMDEEYHIFYTVKLVRYQ